MYHAIVKRIAKRNFGRLTRMACPTCATASVVGMLLGENVTTARHSDVGLLAWKGSSPI